MTRRGSVIRSPFSAHNASILDNTPISLTAPSSTVTAPPSVHTDALDDLGPAARRTELQALDRLEVGRDPATEARIVRIVHRVVRTDTIQAGAPGRSPVRLPWPVTGAPRPPGGF